MALLTVVLSTMQSTPGAQPRVARTWKGSAPTIEEILFQIRRSVSQPVDSRFSCCEGGGVS